VAQGNRLIVPVDGKTTAEFAEVDSAYSSGHIGLCQEANSTIQFRKIEIRELPAL